MSENPRRDDAAREVLAELSRVAHVLRQLRPSGNGEPVVVGPVDGLTLAPVSEQDLAEMLVLQRCCWVQEAFANDTLDLPPLRETLADVRAWSQTWQVWCVRRHGRLVAAVRAQAHGSTWHIGRLMVAPDQAGQGIGPWLLAYAEEQAPTGTSEMVLFTGQRSTRNIELYERVGYTLTPAQAGDGAVDSVRLTRHLTNAQAGR
jgi:ribosomal protein S18 acetylase RimI-like enzyme